MKNSAGPGPRYQALLELLRASESLWNASRLFFSLWNLSPSQFNILNLLSGAGEGLGQTELSRLLITHRSNITGLVDRLEERGLVERRPLDRDRRANRIVLTDRGRELVREVLPHYYEAAEAVWAGVPASSVQPLVNQITLLRRNIEAMKPALSAHENES
jgi:DNA-binding MarR family transcriptional regulator